MARITVIPLFRNKSLSAGDSGTSDSIDLRYCTNQGNFSISQITKQGTFGSAGTTVFTYSGCSTESGTFSTPLSAIAIGTASTAGTSGTTIFSFEPELMPFMKIIATQTGAGTAGADSRVTAELNVQ